MNPIEWSGSTQTVGGDKGTSVQLAVCNKAFACLPTHAVAQTIFNIFPLRTRGRYFYVNNLLPCCVVSFCGGAFAGAC